MDEKREDALYELKDLIRDLMYVLKNDTIIKNTGITNAFIYRWIGKRPIKYVTDEPSSIEYLAEFKRVDELLEIFNEPEYEVIMGISNKKVLRTKKKQNSISGYKKVLTGVENQDSLLRLHKTNPFVHLSMAM